MKIKYERVYLDQEKGFQPSRRGKKWNVAKVTMTLGDKHISFYIKRDKIFHSKFRRQYKAAKQKLLDNQG